MLNLANLRTPGVYIDEVSTFPPSVAPVATAIPAFIGYTRNTTYQGNSLVNVPTRIGSLVEYEEIFGARLETFSAIVATNGAGVNEVTTPPAAPGTVYRMYYALRMYFTNGGGPCWIVSIGADSAAITVNDHTAGINALATEDEPTLILLPDSQGLARSDAYDSYALALTQCETLQDRFTIIDIHDGNLDYLAPGGDDVINDGANGFRTLIGNAALRYGASYYPHLLTSLNWNYNEEALTITGTLNGAPVPANTVLRIFEPADALEEARSVYHTANAVYHEIKASIANLPVVLPPSSAVAGVYATVDANRGVWKSPANVSLRAVRRPMVALNNDSQGDLNLDTTGKAVNAIRTFTGRGTMIWGARTLAGNDNEWRYISVRRFFNFAEESIKKATEPFVFEPNDANTWNKVRAMVENFLTLQWRAGALAGAKPEQAFFVNVGLGTTMTAQDVLNGRLIVEIGMAVVRPAEFIILRFSHKLQEA